jgi:predicted nucleic acid-binding protein
LQQIAGISNGIIGLLLGNLQQAPLHRNGFALAPGPKVYDARIAALCLQHGVKQLWSADRDFGRFSAVTVANPLIT